VNQCNYHTHSLVDTGNSLRGDTWPLYYRTRAMIRQEPRLIEPLTIALTEMQIQTVPPITFDKESSSRGSTRP
jgi:hypothetical protein